MTAPFGADADAQTGKPAADDENVSVNDFHKSYRVPLMSRGAQHVYPFPKSRRGQNVILRR